MAGACAEQRMSMYRFQTGSFLIREPHAAAKEVSAGACALELRRTALIQLAYCALVGTFPFNSFLAGFLSTVGMFVLTVCLRMQVVSGTVTAQRAWAEYAVANLVLHLAVLNFMG